LHDLYFTAKDAKDAKVLKVLKEEKRKSDLIFAVS